MAGMVQQALRENPFASELFVLRAKRADRVKIVAWHGTGLCLFHKRLEKGRFVARTGLVAGVAKAGDCAIIGGLTGQLCGGSMTASIIGACSSTPLSPGKIPSDSRHGALP